ncbi:MAG: hypothetical protein ACUZ8O_14565 [Candidatus Anammoxibacter sp.]
MKLLRIVTATFTPDPNLHKSWSRQFGSIKISSMKLNVKEDSTWTTLLIAEMEIEFPEISQDGFVQIPEEKRRKLEFSLETTANIISVFGRCKKVVSSASPCIALITENEKELEILEATKGIFCERKTLSSAQGTDQLDSEMVTHLQDRLQAVALLAEAQSHSLAVGKFHEYVRLFESAFALQFSQLQKKLLQFLNPVYGYTGGEIKAWTLIRDPLTHADGKKTNEIFLDSDARKYTQRMEQAAYDVLFNKKIWHDRSRERRQVWSPIAATTSATGGFVVKQGSEPTFTFQLFDEFGIFPMHLNAVINDPPQNWWYKMGEQNAKLTSK